MLRPSPCRPVESLHGTMVRQVGRSAPEHLGLPAESRTRRVGQSQSFEMLCRMQEQANRHLILLACVARTAAPGPAFLDTTPEQASFRCRPAPPGFLRADISFTFDHGMAWSPHGGADGRGVSLRPSCAAATPLNGKQAPFFCPPIIAASTCYIHAQISRTATKSRDPDRSEHQLRPRAAACGIGQPATLVLHGDRNQ